VSGAKIALRWNGAPSGSAVAHWRVLQDGKDLIEKRPVPEATVPNEGFHSYTVVAVGENGQNSPESKGWQAPPAWQKLKDTGFQDSFSAAGVTAHKGELWVVGGQDANGKRDEVRVFNPQTNKWRNGPKLPEGISHAPLVSTGDKLYLLGGLTATKDDDGVPLATVYSLDTENPGGTWIEEDKLPALRYGGAAAWDGQRLVFAGGADSFEPNTPRPAAADIWELRGGRWESIDAGLQPARERMAAATDGKGTIWFVGGADHVPRKVYADVDVLSGNKVSDSTPIRTAVQGAAAIWTSETGACVFGGSTVLPNQPAKPVAEVECLDGTDPGWPDLPGARHNAGAAVIDHTVYVVGGTSDPALKPADMVLALRFG
jgi:N-acetylneuraminic acid mutarotase